MQKFSVRHPLIAGYIVTLITVMVFLALRSVVGTDLLNLLGMIALVGLAFYWNTMNSYAKLACEKYDLHFNLGQKERHNPHWPLYFNTVLFAVAAVTILFLNISFYGARIIGVVMAIIAVNAFIPLPTRKLAQNHEIRELVNQLNAKRKAEFYGTTKDQQTMRTISKLAKSEK
ncbi:hypothetical protein ACLUW0_03675 [Limosilactobacillus mucosae]|uniref:Uncharacterized protein n=1 Tax=Limosilactobacillus mucosae TaxID=97478 RepID=A0AAJ1MAK1_LIMMU|nr:hypothetical protein [Limosilactobacillus mucosae]MDD6893366.1 hypothetical protein [Lactobacillus sp.]MDC2829810.1 hypothetical protein [Limosilactobacillus mucosae]MDC2837266.1 hypothetical protein [Limosilactobacillus mucosae]MDC2849488.1 hypothetical protein [Limosilactobacillus mucosae]MDC2853534.1 hypothetical protein [Limosilactobacillus mucosae]